ncbi:hypothetical protein Droror1_Dr00016924 [Drosera rotundifolia]
MIELGGTLFDLLRFDSLEVTTRKLAWRFTGLEVRDPEILRVASAPGKVLITCGRPNSGLMLYTNPRLYAIVKSFQENVKAERLAWAWMDFKLSSPQFSREIVYNMSLKNLTLQCVSSSILESFSIHSCVQAGKFKSPSYCMDSLPHPIATSRLVRSWVKRNLCLRGSSWRRRMKVKAL